MDTLLRYSFRFAKTSFTGAPSSRARPLQTWKYCFAARKESQEEELIQVGIIGGSHGLKGELRVQPTTDFEEDRLGRPGRKWLQTPSGSLINKEGPSLVEMESLGGRRHIYKGHCLWVLKFAGVKTPEEAKKLSGYQIMIKPGDREALPADEYYIQDLIGMDVVRQEDKKLIGEIESIYPARGATDILFVKLKDEAYTEPGLIPFVEDFVPVVDTKQRRVEVTLPEGMLEMVQKLQKPKPSRK